MGKVLPQGNPPKSLRGQPRTPVRLLAHEKAQRWNQCPRQRRRETKNDADGKTVRAMNGFLGSYAAETPINTGEFE